MPRLTLAAVCFSLAAFVTASNAAGEKRAESATQPPPYTFSQLDKDGDGMLSQLEAAGDADAKSNFERLDQNNDEKLSRDEWLPGRQAGATSDQAARSFASLDADGNGRLSQMEVAADADAKSNFEKLDRNNDEQLSLAEWRDRHATSPASAAMKNEARK